MMHTRLAGFTLVELMVTVAIGAILLAVAAPSFTQLLAGQRLEGAASELAADLGYAASEAVSRNGAVSLTTATAGNSYSIAFGAAQLKSVTLASGLSITPSVTVTYQPMRGDSNAATLTLSSTNTSSTLRVNVNSVGMVQICSPSGNFAGYATC